MNGYQPSETWGLISYEANMQPKITEVDIFRKALLSLNISYKKIMKDHDDWVSLKTAYESVKNKANKSEADNAIITKWDAVKNSEPEIPIEIQYCSEFLESSENYCASVRPWYWLIRQKTYEESDRLKDNEEYVSYRGCDYGYLAEDDMLYPYIINGEYNRQFERMGDYIFFDEEVTELYYISENAKRTKIVRAEDGSELSRETTYVNVAPDIYFSFIASRLAIEIAPFIAPDSNVEQRATQQFQLTLQALLKIEEHSRRVRNQDPEEFIL